MQTTIENRRIRVVSERATQLACILPEDTPAHVLAAMRIVADHCAAEAAKLPPAPADARPVEVFGSLERRAKAVLASLPQEPDHLAIRNAQIAVRTIAQGLAALESITHHESQLRLAREAVTSALALARGDVDRAERALDARLDAAWERADELARELPPGVDRHAALRARRLLEESAEIEARIRVGDTRPDDEARYPAVVCEALAALAAVEEDEAGKAVA